VLDNLSEIFDPPSVKWGNGDEVLREDLRRVFGALEVLKGRVGSAYRGRGGGKWRDGR